LNNSHAPVSEREILEAVCEACRRLHAWGLIAAGDGNVSARLDDGRIAITPSGVPKARLSPADLAFLDSEGVQISGRPSSEQLMHLAVYKACPEARCVVHAHPPTAIAWTVAWPELEELPGDALPELILAAGRIPVVPYARPGTAAMGEALTPFLPDHRLLLLARHGALCWGEDLEEATCGIERLEHVAKILKATIDLGGIVPMEPEELEALRSIRARLGPRIR
jgi:L-fuculose-phosphate aldolase